MMKLIFLIPFVACLYSCQEKENVNKKRFFSDESFWNQPIDKNPSIDDRSEKWISILSKEPSGAFFGINTDKFTIPLYEVDSNTPRYTIYHRDPEAKFKSVHGHNNGWFERNKYYGHGPGFGEDVPIPSEASMDPEEDGHIAIVDWEKNTVWDMWGAKKTNGKWYSFTGMKYAADGSGTFEKIDFGIKDGESIHFFGPGRAAGVPVVAGLILFEEVAAGEINHKIACATRFNAVKEFVFPAIWTDGCLKGGLPEGAVIQLNPDLDLNQFNLTKEETILAKAMQKYGLVIVDESGANVIYAEGLYKNAKKSWNEKLRGWKAGIINIPIKNYRVLKVENQKTNGTNSEMLDSIYFQVKKYQM